MSNEQLNEELIIENKMDRYAERIGFGRRLGAYLIDLLAIILLGFLLNSVAGEFLSTLFLGDQMAKIETAAAPFEGMGFDFKGMMNSVLQMITAISMGTILLFILEGSKGQSIGKMMLKIKNTNTDGSETTLKKLWLRAALKYGNTILTLTAGLIGLPFIGSIGSVWFWVIFIGFFFALADKKQTIHDMIAKTVVVRT
jgi:uncharacterized RDD family membrane protein YckC